MSNESRARRLAVEFRTRAGLGDVPLGDIFNVVHIAAGLDVLSLEASEAEHGLSMLDPDTGRVVICVAVTPNPMRQRSSVAHELGHVLAGDLDHPEVLKPGERSPEEIRADTFARHLLLPLEAVHRRLGHGGDVAESEFSGLVQEFEVSPQLAAIQLKEAELIEPSALGRWSALSTQTLAARYGWLSQYRTLAAASAQARAPQSLMTRAVEGYRRGVLGLSELAGWYLRSPDELRSELPEQDWQPADPWDSDGPLFSARPDAVPPASNVLDDGVWEDDADEAGTEHDTRWWASCSTLAPR